MKIKPHCVLTAAWAALAIVSLPCCRRHDARDSLYEAECVFAVGQAESIKTNALGQVVQPSDVSGNFMEIASRFIDDFAQGWRAPVVISMFLGEHADFANYEEDARRAAKNARVELVGWPILTFRILVRSPSREIATGIASAYVRQIQESGGICGREGYYRQMSLFASIERESAIEVAMAENEVLARSNAGKPVPPDLDKKLATARRRQAQAGRTRETFVNDLASEGELIQQIGAVRCREVPGGEQIKEPMK